MIENEKLLEKEYNPFATERQSSWTIDIKINDEGFLLLQEWAYAHSCTIEDEIVSLVNDGFKYRRERYEMEVDTL